MTATTSPLRHLDLGGADPMHVAYVDNDPGTGATPLVFLHGGAADQRMWGPQLGAFPERRVIAPDARGHGLSSRATTARLCDDVVALLDALSIEQAILAGISMGGGTAVDVALEHPERVAGLVVGGTGTSEPEFTEPWVLERFAEWARAAAEGDAESWLATFLQFAAGPYRDLDDVDPQVIDLFATMGRDILTRQVTLDDEGVPVAPAQPTPVADTWDRLPTITVPVLAVSGALDGEDHRAMGRRLAEAVPYGEHVVIDGSAHYPNLERPEEFNQAVRALSQAVHSGLAAKPR